MKLFTKILLLTLILTLFSTVLSGTVSWNLAYQSQTEMSTLWLESRLGDAINTANKYYSLMDGMDRNGQLYQLTRSKAAIALAEMRVAKQGFVFVLDSEGKILAHPNPLMAGQMAVEFEDGQQPWVNEVLANRQGKIDFNMDGVSLIGAYEEYLPWGWTVIICAPVDAVYDSINRARTTATVFNITATIVIAALLVFLTSRITAPLELMALGTGEMRRGNFKIRIPVKSKDEIGALANSFNQMAIQLEATIEALNRSEKHSRALIDNLNDVLCVLNPEGQIIFVSSSVSGLGYKPWQLIGKRVYDFVLPEDLPRLVFDLKRVYEHSPYFGPQEYCVRTGDGKWRVCEAQSVNLLDEPHISGVVVTLRDIEDRKQAEALQASIYQISEAAFRAGTMEELFNAVHNIISQLMPASNFYVALYDQATQMLTFPYFIDEFEPAPPPAALGRGLTEYVLRTGDPLLATPEIFDQMVSTGEIDSVGAPSIDWLGVPLKVNDQSIGVLVVQSYSEAVRLCDSDREILQFVSEQSAMSIARKQAEDNTRISEMRYRELFENSPVSLWEEDFSSVFDLIDQLRLQGVTDFSSYFSAHPEVVYECIASIKVLDVNQATLQLYGASTKQELMHQLDRLLTPKGVHLFVEELIAIANGSTDFIGNGANCRINGQEIDIILSWKMSAGPKRIIVCIVDVTERRHAEERAQAQLQRLNALRAIDMSITSSLDLRSTLKVLLDQVSQQLQVDAAAVLLMDPFVLTLNYAASQGFHTRALQHTSLRLGEGYAGKAALERTLVSNHNLVSSPGDLENSPKFGQEGFVSYFAAPLIAKGQVKGVLEIFNRSPLDPPQEWLDFLETLARQAAIAIDNATLFNDLQRSNVELTLAYDATIEGWSRALDMRDRETEGHTQRVTEATLELAMILGVNRSELVHLRWGALLHDIGKMGISDSILLKPGSLDSDERDMMEKHPIYAYEMLLPIAYLRPALDIPYYHHEKWDGSGYPCKLKGEEIPLPARIFSVIDVWDALRSDRPYRAAWNDEAVRNYLQSEAGKHFDPHIVEAFLQFLTAQKESQLREFQR